ncbi:hypothetical protein [Phytoactinopolyspora endophytica]|uniref:hypothetical protein n=1 Tax=Phytoactinopolyspora endophytica TaxID=1642495 RepID=UPI00101D8895|nr:hypothetical protein [Phytoactinopolyspora endophytica]
MISSTSNLTARRGLGLRAVAGAFLGAALLFTTAACGSDDSDDTTASSSENDDSQTEDEPADAADEQDAEDAEEDTEDAEESMDSGDYCGKIEEFGNSILDSGSAIGDPDALPELVEAYREIASVAPADHAEDWNAMADAMDSIADLDMSDPDSLEDMEQLDVEGAMTRIGEHVQSACS